jgi:hypothetical protein
MDGKELALPWVIGTRIFMLIIERPLLHQGAYYFAVRGYQVGQLKYCEGIWSCRINGINNITGDDLYELEQILIERRWLTIGYNNHA